MMSSSGCFWLSVSFIFEPKNNLAPIYLVGLFALLIFAPVYILWAAFVFILLPKTVPSINLGL